MIEVVIPLKELDVPSEVLEFIMVQAALKMDPEVPNSNIKNLAAWHEAIRLGACYGYQCALTDINCGSFKPDDPNA
jgi:hypothetical protein